MHPIEPFVIFIFCLLEMLFSVSPGAKMGFAFSGRDWQGLLGDLSSKDLQTKRALRAAATRSFALQSAFFAVVLPLSWMTGHYSADRGCAWLAGSLSGLLLGYLMLLRITRAGSWYGHD